MKALAIRLSVLTLALTGFSASTIASIRPVKVEAPKSCQPTCPPFRGQTCGID